MNVAKGVFTQYFGVARKDAEGLLQVAVIPEGFSDLNTTKVVGMEDAQTSMINLDSMTYVFTNDSSKMGQEVDDEVINSIAEKVKGVTSSEAVQDVIKTSDGSKKVAVYQYLPEHGWLYVMYGDYDKAFASVTTVSLVVCFAFLFLIAVLGVVTLFVVRNMTKGLSVVGDNLYKIGNLDFTGLDDMSEYSKQPDERLYECYGTGI